MVDTDWREILSFSQRELGQADKEKICESLSWMEADDIELNFSDLKSLFRLAQDILKFKSEQVNNLLGQLETVNRKEGRKKKKSTHTEVPSSTDDVLEKIAHQEEVIKANKEILEQLYADIAELEGRKTKLLDDKNNLDDSESSRDALSEMDAVVQLENDLAKKNKHIRKLLGDIKVTEDENTNLKKKITVLKDKLTEASQLINNLTEQLLSMNNECTRLKEILGNSELAKTQQLSEIESLRKELFEKDSNRDNIYEEIKSKVQHWKNVAKTKKSELEALSIENAKLKDRLTQASTKTSSPKPRSPKTDINERKIKELQEKLTEASNEMEQSANLISLLKAENRQLKGIIEETPDHSTFDHKNESDDHKQRILINKLKRKIKSLSVSLHGAEEMIANREKEFAEIASELQTLKSDQGISSLSESVKNKTKQIKIKDDEIKSMVHEINKLNRQVNDLQLQNETMRQKFNVSADEIIPTDGIIKQYKDSENKNSELNKELRTIENKLVNAELDNRKSKNMFSKLKSFVRSLGYNESKLEDILQDCNNDETSIVSEEDEKVDSSNVKQLAELQKDFEETIKQKDVEIKEAIEENEGLRKGLQEILDFLKDNSTTSSGILALQCPSLDVLLRSMEARHAAGWFAPHMTTIMELREAIGGKDALLAALHNARKETYDVMSQLSKETQKSTELERKLQEIESKQQKQPKTGPTKQPNPLEFGSWVAENETNNIDVNDKSAVENMLAKGNSMYESQLKKGLEYFCSKYKILYDKIAALTIQAADDQNKWSIQEEQYKAQIENLKDQLQQQEDDDISDKSPGIISIPNPIHLKRKCSYLEESYKYIRTLNENIKNENMEAKREMLTMASEYEIELHTLILSVISLSDKLRNSVPMDLFWKQNIALNELTVKHRKLLENCATYKKEPDDILARLQKYKFDIINNLRGDLQTCVGTPRNTTDQMLSKIEESVLNKQVQELCTEIETRDKRIEFLENKNIELQEAQTQIIDHSLSSLTEQDTIFLKNEIKSLTEENKMLKDKSSHVSNQLEVALLQLQNYQQRELSSDMEVNLLRHQILDLQSSSDNKAIVSRLSGEVLVAHLQASESHKQIERLNSALCKEKEMRSEVEDMLKARQKFFDVFSFRYESKFRYMFEVMQVLRQQYQGSVPLVSIENYLNKMEDFARENKALNEKLQEIEDLRSSLMTKHTVFDQILNISRNKCVIEENSCIHKLKSIMMESTHSRDLDHLNKKLRMSEDSREDLIKRYNQLEKTIVLVNQGFEKSNLLCLVGKKSEGEISVSNLELEDVQSDDDSSSKRNETFNLPKPLVLKPLNSKNGNNKNGGNKNDDKKDGNHKNGDDKNGNNRNGDNRNGDNQNGDNKNGANKNGGNRNRSNKNGNNTKITDNKDLTLKNKLDIVQASTNSTHESKRAEVISVQVQTMFFEKMLENATTQTTEDREIGDLKHSISRLKISNEKQSKELKEALSLIQQRNEDNLKLNTDKITLEASIKSLKTNINHKESLNDRMRISIEELRNELKKLKSQQSNEFYNKTEKDNEENSTLLLALKQLESDKNNIADEYKKLLDNEREEYANTMKELNMKVIELQSKLDSKTSDSNDTSSGTLKEIDNKYTMKIVDLEDKCFKLQSELDECKSELSNYQTEADRWKELATERLAKMEQLNSQLGERHCQEVESYKAENQHWLTQLNETQREHMELRSRLTEQKTIYIKQLSEKDSQIEQMRSAINNLKAQIMSMQTMISVHDPSFDLSAIVEVEESDGLSQRGSDRLEIKFDSSCEINDLVEEFARIPSSSTAIWQEPIIERLRRDKQLVMKQNTILRRQIKALAARERRSRLDAQNLKNQVFRISTTGNKVATAESAALHNKITTLQAQLMSARRDTHSSINLWDKWKRAQQASDKWQARYEEKCQEVKKIENSLNMTKSALIRLEREKRLLMSKLSECKSDQLSIEKQESESPEKSHRSITECITCMNASSLSNHALLDRIQAQQRRIAALEVAEKGNEFLVSEYEKALAEVTSLKGQVLKLESTLLEAQIRSPLKSNADTQPELEYWKSYCEMLKDENVQLNLRVNSMDAAPATAHQHRINDLEQTILTLRGLVSKLQSEQKSGSVVHRRDSRPSSGRSVSEKSRSQVETHRIEVANLKRSIHDKDLLLERSKEMLKIAAEREDELLRENAFLRRQLDDITKPKDGFLSA